MGNPREDWVLENQEGYVVRRFDREKKEWWESPNLTLYQAKEAAKIMHPSFMFYATRFNKQEDVLQIAFISRQEIIAKENDA